MSGILNWAIWGLRELRRDKRIDQPASGMHLKRQMLTMTAPVSQFLEDLVIVSNDTNYSVGVHDLYEKFLEWGSERDRVKKIDQEHFRSAISNLYPNTVFQIEARGSRRESRILGMQVKAVEAAGLELEGAW
jgi:phage/plasmid-associated DNA primase